MLRGGGGVTGGGAVTVTRVSALVLPPGPDARAVYVVELDGATVRLPEASTVPRPLSIVTVVALVEFQDSVEDCPCSMVDGEAESLIVGAAGGRAGGGVSTFGGGGGGGVTVFLQAVPVITMIVSKISAAASIYRERLILVPPSFGAEFEKAPVIFLWLR